MNTSDRDNAAPGQGAEGPRRSFDIGFALLAACAMIVALAASLYFCFGHAGQPQTRAGVASPDARRSFLRQGEPSAEAVVRMSIARELFGDDSRGYHALIDSALMAPLPTLLAVPFLSLDRKLGVGAGFYGLTSLLSALCAGYLLFLARRLGTHWLAGAGAAIVLLFNPWTPLAAWRGASATGSLLLATAACAHLLSWLRAGSATPTAQPSDGRAGSHSRGLFSLGLSANILAFAVIWEPWFLALAVVLAALVAGHAARRFEAAGEPPTGTSRPSGRLQGLMLIFLTPVVYLPAIWVLFNWLIFKDAARLARDAAPLVAPWLAPVAAGAGLVAGCAWLLARSTSFAPLAAAMTFLLAVAGVGALAAMPASDARNALLGQALTGEADRRDGEELSRYLRETKGGRMILVIGRPGYLIQNMVGSDTTFIHRLDLDVASVLKDTPGRKVYAVLTEDQVGWWKPRLERQSAGLWDWDFLEDRRIGRWRVLACIRRA